jgi:hypothetical protein
MHKNYSLLLILCLSLVSQVHAQEKPRDFNPYSRFGIGDLSDPHFATVSQMGGIGAGFTDRNILNSANPASLGALRNAAFEGGVSLKSTSLTESSLHKTFFGGGLDYLALGLPLFNSINEALDRKERDLHIGTMFYLKPYSQVGYDIAQIDSLEGTGRFQSHYTGSGGTYEFKWATGLEYKNLSFGGSLGYVFGKLSYKRELDLLSVSLPYNSIALTQTSMKGFRWSLGAQYKINLRKLKEGEIESSKYLSLGIYGQSTQSFTTTTDQLYRRELLTSSTTGISDTVKMVSGVSGTGKLPGEIHFGFFYNDKYHLQFGGQVSLVSWSAYQNSIKPDILKDAQQVAFGISYCPDIESIDNFFKRISYRLGVRFGTDPRSFDGAQVKNYNVSFGVGVPFIFNRKVSFSNLGVEFGNIGIQNKLNAHYFGVRMGFTLNDDEWFLKRKYN